MKLDLKVLHDPATVGPIKLRINVVEVKKAREVPPPPCPARVVVELRATVTEPKVSAKIRRMKNGSVKLDVKVLQDPTSCPIKLRLKYVRSDEPVKSADVLELEHKMKEWDHAVEAIKAGDAYQHQLSRYQIRTDAESAAIRSVFGKTAKKNGWEFDGSIVTDGVAVSMQYSMVIECSRKSPPRVQKTAKDSMDHNYNKKQPTVLRGGDGRVIAIVLGVDPGRANIGTVGYVLDAETAAMFPNAPNKKSWSLSRGEFYAGAKVWKADRAQRRRFKDLTHLFEGMKDGSVRSADSEDIKKYLAVYTSIQEAWWSLVLRRRESRATLQRYAGKRSVLDSFFSKVQKSVKDMFPGVSIHVGYGSAILSMKSTGKGEISVPTTGAFKACKRVFGPQNVAPTDEFRTTMVDRQEGSCLSDRRVEEGWRRIGAVQLQGRSHI